MSHFPIVALSGLARSLTGFRHAHQGGPRQISDMTGAAIGEKHHSGRFKSA
jgi:hypothetical protein